MCNLYFINGTKFPVSHTKLSHGISNIIIAMLLVTTLRHTSCLSVELITDSFIYFEAASAQTHTHTHI